MFPFSVLSHFLSLNIIKAISVSSRDSLVCKKAFKWQSAFSHLRAFKSNKSVSWNRNRRTVRSSKKSSGLTQPGSTGEAEEFSWPGTKAVHLDHQSTSQTYQCNIYIIVIQKCKSYVCNTYSNLFFNLFLVFNNQTQYFNPLS